MKKNNLLLSSLLLILLVPALAGCTQREDVIYLHVLNSEEYIYEQESDDEPENMTAQFETDYLERTGQKVRVIYETFDTNETMLNTLKTGKATYDLVCTSDYVIQKMMANDMIEKFDQSKVSNYIDHCPEFLRNVFRDITAENKEKEVLVMDDYAVGYMWGTLGILYNPEFETFVERLEKEDPRDYSTEKIMEDLMDWNYLWDSKYKGTISIKDSMRDTYSVGIMRVYDEEFRDLKDQYEGAGEYEDETKHTELYNDSAKYNKALTDIFNRSDKETVAAVQKELLSLKENIFGFEVDSGKEDIKVGKIGINIAWSGDAVYAMDGAEEYGVDLYYNIPETGGNIWFDGWVMPKSKSLNKELAQDFVNFLCDPENAQLNMYGVGYTPFIGGDDILEYAKIMYDERAYYLYQYNTEKDDWVYDDEGNLVPIEGREALDWNSPEAIAYAVSKGIEPVNLSYMFEGTRGGEDDYDAIDMVFYPSEIGRQFSTQYPDGETIKRLAVMKDFGDNNKYILDMWENVKTNSLPLWAIILLIVEGVVALAIVLYLFIKKRVNKTLRIKRRKAAAK